MCARARRGERRGVGGQMAHGRPEMIRGRCCCVRSVSVETLVLWVLTYGPRPIYRRRAGDSSFCPSVNLVSRARPTVCLIRRGGRGGGGPWTGAVGRGGVARMLEGGGGYTSLPGMITQQPLISSCRGDPRVETSCSPRCRIKSWMSLPTGTIWSRGMADFTISCLV